MAHAKRKPSNANGASLRAALAMFFGKTNAVHGNRLSAIWRCNTSKVCCNDKNKKTSAYGAEIDETGRWPRSQVEASAVGDACSTEGSSNASIQ